jgi:LuxR family maltose regulon positive regulatory protein
VLTDLAAAKPVNGPPDGDDPLLESKFAIPERPRFMVRRPRLLERLSSGVHESVTLVVGPAGSGKTQLVASWVTSGSVTAPVAWITLEDDDQSGLFWTYVVEGLRRAGVSLAPSFAPMMSLRTVDRSFLTRLAAALSEQPSPVVLVLDGVSNLTGQQWATDLEYVLRHTSRMLQLVLVGRWDPPLPLHRYRLAGSLNEVRSEDLAFTPAEVAELLALHGVELSPSGLRSLQEHTEGWAAGSKLFALALEGRCDADNLVTTITGDETTIAEYFVDEVLRGQPAHVRRFLLETSILDTFTPDLAEALTGRSDAGRMLAELERQNAFVQPTGDSSTTYRCHRLFAELLRAQLAGKARTRTSQLHRRAADWFAARGQTVEAVGHSVKAVDWDTAAAIVVEGNAVGRLVLDGRAGRLGALFRDLPEDLDNAEVAMIAAALALADGDPDRCAHHLTRAEGLAVGRGGEQSPAAALAGLVLRTLLAGAYGDSTRVLNSALLAEYHLTLVPPERLIGHPELRVLLLAATGTAQSRLGAIDAAAVTLAEAVAAPATGCEYLRIDCLQHLALIEAYRGRLGQAERLANQAIDLADGCGLGRGHRPVGAELALAWVAMERYDVDTAGRHLRAADPRGRGADGLTAAAFALVKARRLRARGELRGAMNALRDVTAAPDGQAPPEWLAREITLCQARLMIAVGRPEEALARVGQFPEPHSADVAVVHGAALLAGGEPERAREVVMPVVSATGPTSPVVVEAWLVLATVAAHNGEVGPARDALGQALRFATPEAQRRAVQQVWAQLRRILRDDEELAQHYRALQAQSRAIHGPRADAAAADPAVIVEPLSRREMEVLQGIAAMLPTEEIAATMYVSINTVKTHVRSILRKLSAARRNEAVRRARALGLV